MSDLMDKAVLTMPYELAMGDELSRMQFWSRVQLFYKEQHSRIEADEALMKAALSALEESIDIVGEDYRTDWRHGLPTRKAQLDGKKEQLDAHESAITALRARLAAAPPPVQGGET
jgi:hypothetical protein